MCCFKGENCKEQCKELEGKPVGGVDVGFFFPREFFEQKEKIKMFTIIVDSKSNT